MKLTDMIAREQAAAAAASRGHQPQPQKNQPGLLQTLTRAAGMGASGHTPAPCQGQDQNQGSSPGGYSSSNPTSNETSPQQHDGKPETGGGATVLHQQQPPAAVASRTPTKRTRTPGGRRQRKAWTHAEEWNLLKGVERFGAGKWATILEVFKFDDRTSVDLKDKWRNRQKMTARLNAQKAAREAAEAKQRQQMLDFQQQQRAVAAAAAAAGGAYGQQPPPAYAHHHPHPQQQPGMVAPKFMPSVNAHQTPAPKFAPHTHAHATSHAQQPQLKFMPMVQQQQQQPTSAAPPSSSSGGAYPATAPYPPQGTHPPQGTYPPHTSFSSSSSAPYQAQVMCGGGGTAETQTRQQPPVAAAAGGYTNRQHAPPAKFHSPCGAPGPAQKFAAATKAPPTSGPRPAQQVPHEAHDGWASQKYMPPAQSGYHAQANAPAPAPQQLQLQQQQQPTSPAPFRTCARDPQGIRELFVEQTEPVFVPQQQTHDALYSHHQPSASNSAALQQPPQQEQPAPQDGVYFQQTAVPPQQQHAGQHHPPPSSQQTHHQLAGGNPPKPATAQYQTPSASQTHTAPMQHETFAQQAPPPQGGGGGVTHLFAPQYTYVQNQIQVHASTHAHQAPQQPPQQQHHTVDHTNPTEPNAAAGTLLLSPKQQPPPDVGGGDDGGAAAMVDIDFGTATVTAAATAAAIEVPKGFPDPTEAARQIGENRRTYKYTTGGRYACNGTGNDKTQALATVDKWHTEQEASLSAGLARAVPGPPLPGFACHCQQGLAVQDDIIQCMRCKNWFHVFCLGKSKHLCIACSEAFRAMKDEEDIN